GQRGGGLPAGARLGGVRQAEPVVRDGEGGQQEPAKADLLEDRRNDGAEQSDEPCIRLRVKEIIDRQRLWRSNEVGDRLHRHAKQQAKRHQLRRLVARDCPTPLQSIEKSALPHQRIEDPRRQQRGEVCRRQQGDLQLRVQQLGHAVVFCSRRSSQSHENKLKKNKHHSREADKHKRVSDVGNAPQRCRTILTGGSLCVRRVFAARRLFQSGRVFWTVCGDETHADFFLLMDALFAKTFVVFSDTDFFAVFFATLGARAEGTPVFFSGAMNLPRAAFTWSGAAAISNGCGPAWLTPPPPLDEIRLAQFDPAWSAP